MGFFGRFAVVAVVGIGVLLAVLYDMTRQQGLIKLQKQPFPTITQNPKGTSEKPSPTTENTTKETPPQETEHQSPKNQPSTAVSVEPHTSTKQNTPEKVENTPQTQHKTTSPKRLLIPAHHRVKRGETLAGIARKYFGDWRLWRAIAYANNIKKVGDLKVGQEITIPALKVHKVQVGETLYSICLKHRRESHLEGTLSELVKRVADINGIEPSKLRAGQVIALPLK